MAIVVAVYLLVHGLMVLSGKSVWSDESFSIALVNQPWLEVLKGSVADVHPPLYFLLLKLFSHNELTMRLLSHLATLGTAIGVYKLTTYLANKEAGYIAGVMVAISPYFLQSSNELRGYALLGCLVTWGTLAYEKGWAKTFVLCALGAVATEHYSWIWVCAMSLRLFKDSYYGEVDSKMVKAWTWAIILAFPFALLTMHQMTAEQVGVAGRMTEYYNPLWLGKKLIGVPWHMVNGYGFSMMTGDAIQQAFRDPLLWLSGITLLIGLISAVFGANRRIGYYLLTCLVIPTLLLIVFYPIRLHARYLIFGAPFLYIAMANGLELMRPTVKAWVIVSMLLGSWYAISLPTDSVHRHDFRSQVMDARDNCKPENDCGFSGNEPQVQYYMGDRHIGLKPFYKEFWVLDLSNMHEEVTQQSLGYLTDRMDKLGYDYHKTLTYSMNRTYVFHRRQP